MQTAIIKPKDPRLHKYIEYYWQLIGGKGDGNHLQVLPAENRYDVVVSFASSTIWKDRKHSEVEFKGSFVSGMRKEPVSYDCQGDVDYLAIRFYPHGLYRFLNFPPAEIASSLAVDLDVFEEITWRGLTEKLGNIINPGLRIQALEKELLFLFESRSKSPTPLLEQVLYDIHESEGAANMSYIQEKLNIYPKKLEREFLKYIGITPKIYSRIFRFSCLFEYVQNQGRIVNWADLAYSFGYYDQSHFIKEFTQFLGYSPEKFQTLKNKSHANESTKSIYQKAA